VVVAVVVAAAAVVLVLVVVCCAGEESRRRLFNGRAARGRDLRVSTQEWGRDREDVRRSEGRLGTHGRSPPRSGDNVFAARTPDLRLRLGRSAHDRSRSMGRTPAETVADLPRAETKHERDKPARCSSRLVS
jgi:hypothetical protein